MASQGIGRYGTVPQGHVNRPTWRTTDSRKLSLDGVPLFENVPSANGGNDNPPLQPGVEGEDASGRKTQLSNIESVTKNRTSGQVESARTGLRLPFQSVKGTGEDGAQKHVWASTRRQNGVLQVDRPCPVQEVSEPGATALEVNAIYRIKLVANRVKVLWDNTHVQRAWGVIFAILLSWFVGRLAMSLIPGLRNEVGEFLNAVDLQHYSGQLADKGYLNLQDMLLVTDEDLRDYVGIVIAPHRRRILHHAQELKQQKLLLPAVLWLATTTSALAMALVGVAVLVSPQVRERVVCVAMFFAFMSWHRARLWHRLWSTLDTSSSPRVVPKVCEPPTVMEPQRTFSSTSILTSPTGKGAGGADARTAGAQTVQPRNGDNHLLSRLKKRRNRPSS